MLGVNMLVHNTTHNYVSIQFKTEAEAIAFKKMCRAFDVPLTYKDDKYKTVAYLNVKTEK